jgi:hypothetical protein
MVQVGLPYSPTANIDGKDETFPFYVAVIDSTIDNHPAINVAVRKNFISSGSVYPITYGHGTNIAGIIGEKDDNGYTVGVAPGIGIYSTAVLANNGRGLVSDMIRAISDIVKNSDKIAVANMSIVVVGSSSALHAAIISAVNKGIIFVACAGNNSVDIYGSDGKYGNSDDILPAAYPEVVAVSAVNGNIFASFSDYSRSVVPWNPVVSPGAGIDLAAPGVNIHGPWLNGGYSARSGTSQAAAIVSGAFALAVKRFGRDINKDGKIDAEDVAIFRQLLIYLSKPQSEWGISNTQDRDSNREGLLNIKGL